MPGVLHLVKLAERFAGFSAPWLGVKPPLQFRAGEVKNKNLGIMESFLKLLAKEGYLREGYKKNADDWWG